jgi:WD40-like Beta Propeller Repeat
MTPFRPRAGRPDDWNSPHERARFRAAERLSEPLDATEAGWLDAHLAGCADCRAVTDAYAADRLLLRALLDQAPVPPRDLWARTALAIEREADHRAGRTGRPRLARRASRESSRSVLPLGVVSGLLVVLVVASASLLSGGLGPLLNGNGVASAPALSLGPGATPIAITARVGYLQSARDGSYDLHLENIGEVCPTGDKAACAPLGGGGSSSIKLPDAPRSVVLSPSSAQIVVVSSDAGRSGNGGSVYVLPVPTPVATPKPEASGPGASAVAPTRSSAPVGTTSASGVPTSSGSPATSPSASSGPSPSASPNSTPAASPTPAASSPVASHAAVATSSPPSTPAPGGSSSPNASPSSQVPAAPIQIAHGVIVVGGSGAYSPDGRWFAFSARRAVVAQGPEGPDIYLWKVGDTTASIVTSDHHSVFAEWLGNSILGSRVVPAGAAAGLESSGNASGSASSVAGRTLRGTSFLIDPATGAVAPIGNGLWRPVVDPTGVRAVSWDGTLSAGSDGVSWQPDTGQIVLADWDASSGRASAGPAPGSSSPSSRPRSSTKLSAPAQTLAVGPFADFDARFDPTGTRLAIWTADPATPAIGHLSLLTIDPATGATDLDKAPLPKVPALGGFSIDDGRLAWVTPPGQDGQGSRVQVLGWTGDSFGSIETVPAGQFLIIR